MSVVYSESYVPMFGLVYKNHIQYCALNGYDYTPRMVSNFDCYSDLLEIQRLLPLYDVVMLGGLDMLFMKNVKIEDIFPEEYDQQIAKENLSGGSATICNNGGMLWRNRKSSFDIIERLINYKKVIIRNSSLNWQLAISDSLKAKEALVSKMNLVEESVMNTHPDHEVGGEFFLHYYCSTFEGKMQRMKERIEKGGTL